MLQLITHFIDKDSFKEGLYALVNFDNDVNGENGEEFTWKVALDNGYKTTIDYLVNESINKKGISQKTIEYILNTFFTKENHYEEYVFEVHDNNTEYIVTMAYITQ